MSTTATVRNIKGNLRALVAQTVYEVVNDPDFGLDLTQKARRRLRAALRSRRRGIPLAEAKRRLL